MCMVALRWGFFNVERNMAERASTYRCTPSKQSNMSKSTPSCLNRVFQYRGMLRRKLSISMRCAWNAWAETPMLSADSKQISQSNPLETDRTYPCICAFLESRIRV